MPNPLFSRKIRQIDEIFWKWHWFFSLGKWHWFLAISKFSLGKKVNAKSINFTEKLTCTIKFLPIVYLVNHVEICNSSGNKTQLPKSQRCSINNCWTNKHEYDADTHASVCVITIRTSNAYIRNHVTLHEKEDCRLRSTSRKIDVCWDMSSIKLISKKFRFCYYCSWSVLPTFIQCSRSKQSQTLEKVTFIGNLAILNYLF